MKTPREMGITLLAAEAHFRDLAQDLVDQLDAEKKIGDITELADAMLCGAIAMQKVEHDFQFNEVLLMRFFRDGMKASRKAGN